MQIITTCKNISVIAQDVKGKKKKNHDDMKHKTRFKHII